MSHNAELYDGSYIFLQEEKKRIIEENVKNMTFGQNEMILDVGCGPGQLTLNVILPFFKPYLKHIVGVDMDKSMITFAEEKYSHPQIYYKELDFGKPVTEEIKSELLLSDQTLNGFDKIISMSCWMYIRDQRTAARNIYTLLKPSGEVLLVLNGKTTQGKMLLGLSKMSKWAKYMQELWLTRYLRCQYANESLVAYVEDIPKAAELLCSPDTKEQIVKTIVNCIREADRTGMTFASEPRNFAQLEDLCRKSLYPLPQLSDHVSYVCQVAHCQHSTFGHPSDMWYLLHSLGCIVHKHNQAPNFLQVEPFYQADKFSSDLVHLQDNIENYISVFYFHENAAEELKQSLEKAGLEVMYCTGTPIAPKYENQQVFKDIMRSIHTCLENIPSEMREEHMNDAMEVIKEEYEHCENRRIKITALARKP